jgi:hypothetical protein
MRHSGSTKKNDTIKSAEFYCYVADSRNEKNTWMSAQIIDNIELQ